MGKKTVLAVHAVLLVFGRALACSLAGEATQTFDLRSTARGCTRYQGSVVSNTVAEDAQPWECVVVRWDKYEELMRVCPWELSDVQADAVGNKVNKSRGSE